MRRQNTQGARSREETNDPLLAERHNIRTEINISLDAVDNNELPVCVRNIDEIFLNSRGSFVSNISNADNYTHVHRIEERRQNNGRRKSKDFLFGLTNARSLGHKFGSLAEVFDEMGLSFAIVTETWFCDSRSLEDFREECKNEYGLLMQLKNKEKAFEFQPRWGDRCRLQSEAD